MQVLDKDTVKLVAKEYEVEVIDKEEAGRQASGLEDCRNSRRGCFAYMVDRRLDSWVSVWTVMIEKP